MCKINKKQNAHGVTVRSLWNLGQGCIQEGRLFQIYSKWFKSDSHEAANTAFLSPALSLRLPSLSFSIWDSRTWWKVISLNGILRKLLLGIYVIPARGNEQMCLWVSQEKDNAFTLLGTRASLCAKISMLPLCSISEHPIFFSGEMLLVNFGLFTNWVRFFLALLWCLGSCVKADVFLKMLFKILFDSMEWCYGLHRDCVRIRKGTEIVYYSHKSCSKMSECWCVR